MGCSIASTDATEDEASTESAYTYRSVQRKSYTGAAAWSAACEGAPITQADLEAMLGDRQSRVLGRFEIALRDRCNPWVNGMSSCGPSGESIEAYRGDARFAFGLEPSEYPFAAWRFKSGPLLIHDHGDVIARRHEGRIVVQLVGELSRTTLATRREMDGTLTGSETLRARLLSSDLVEGTAPFRAELRAAAGVTGTRLDAASIDLDTLRYTSPPLPVTEVGISRMAFGQESWGVAGSLEGIVTPSCLRFTSVMNPKAIAIVASFDAL